jgi:hypothetical protein
MSRSGDRSSDARKRALRLLAREHFADYTSIYEEVRPAAQSRYQARDLARTRLRYRFPARYLELYAQEQAGPRTDVPADIRSKSWQRSLARLADLRTPAYQKLFAQFRAEGMSRPRAADRAMAALREANSDLFARLLAEEYQLWLIATAPELPTSDASRGGEDPGTDMERNAPGRQEQASIGELGSGDDGEQADTGIADLAAWRMLRRPRRLHD